MSLHLHLGRFASPASHSSQTPWELFFGRKPDVSGIRVFGSKAYVHVPKQLRRKLDSLSTAGIFIGYELNSKAYRVLMDSGKVQVSRDVIFLARVPPATNKAAATEAEQANNKVSAGVPDSPITAQDNTGIDLTHTPLTQKLRKKLLRQPLRIQLPPQLRRLSSHAFLKGRGGSLNRSTKPRKQWQLNLRSLRPIQKQCGLQMHLSGSLQWMKK